MTSAVSNARWVGTIQAVRVSAQLLSILILSRLLAPEDFGLVAMAFAISNFALLVRDLGSGAAIIQRAVLEPETTSTAHWSNCLIGAVLGAALFLLSAPFAALLKEPALQSLLQVLAISFPVLGSTTVHQALLERESRFALLARIEISAVLSGFMIAVVSALLGAGAYSLVLQTLSIAIVSALQLWGASKLRLGCGLSLHRARELWRFSGHLLGFNVVNYFARNADTMIIGRALGAASLGPYSLAYRIMLFPVQNLTFVAARALLPVMSRTQDAVAQLGSLYRRTLSVISFFTAPLMAGLFVLREPFVAVALDESWSSVARIIAWLAPVGFIQSLVSAGGVVLTALGRTEVLFRLGLFGTAVHVGAFVIGVAWGITGVAAAYLVAALLNAAVCLFVLLRLLSQPVTRLAGAVLPSIARALLMAVAIHFVDLELAALTVAPLLRLVALSLGGAVFYLALTRAHPLPSECDVWRLLLKKA
jgi:O-antigen/teichoic acid export membrane protein